LGPTGSSNDKSPTVSIEIQRGEERLTLTVHVQSLSSLEATEFMELSGAVLHRLSYQQAKRHNLAVQGVYVSTRGHMFQSQVGANTVILAIGSQVSYNFVFRCSCFFIDFEKYGWKL
jgi:hypothetical protein